MHLLYSIENEMQCPPITITLSSFILRILSLLSIQIEAKEEEQQKKKRRNLILC